MSAELLREAAALMRAEAVQVCRPLARQELVALAVADWLERVAPTWWAGDDPEEVSALAVARAYLNDVTS